MAQTTELSVLALPGMIHSFVAKAAGAIIIPGCGILTSIPLVTGKICSNVRVSGQFQSEPKVTGTLGTPICED